jgi:hypothetical protein
MPSARTTSPILAAAAIAFVCLPQSAETRVVGFEILSQGPAYDGASFGEVGPFERIDAIARSPSIPPRRERPPDDGGVWTTMPWFASGRAPLVHLAKPGGASRPAWLQSSGIDRRRASRPRLRSRPA